MILLGFTTGNNYLDSGLENYLFHGLQPGGFLTALIVDDLQDARTRADVWNSKNIKNIYSVLFRRMPKESVGSREKYNDWLNDKDNRRTNYRTKVEKERMLERLSSNPRDVLRFR